MSEFKMPSLGADMESAVLMEWKVKEGDHVTKGQVIAEVETSKGVIEIEVFEDGIVDKILVKEETECAVGTPLAMIRAEGEVEKTAPENEAEVLKEGVAGTGGSAFGRGETKRSRADTSAERGGGRCGLAGAH